MTTRGVIGDVHFLDDSAAEGDIVRFRLERVGFAEDAIYMPSDVDTVVQANGTIERVELWASAEGGRNLLCILPNGYTWKFRLEPGDTDITLQELHALNAPLEPEVSPTIQELIDAAVAAAIAPIDLDFANERARYASQTIPGTSLIGHLAPGVGSIGRTLYDKLNEGAVSLRDFGAIADNATDIAPAFTAMLTTAGPNGVGLLPPGQYFLNTVTDLTAVRAIIAYGVRIRLGFSGILRVLASNTTWYGTTFFYDSALDNTRITLFANRDTADGYTPGNYGDVNFVDCVFDGVSWVASKLGRLSSPTFVDATTLRAATASGATVITVEDPAPLAASDTIRLGPVNNVASPDYGDYIYRDVLGRSGADLTVAATSGDLPAGSAVSGVTRLNGQHLIGATVLTVRSVASFVVGNYALLPLSTTLIHQAVVDAIDPDLLTITLHTGLPATAADNTPVGPMSTGVLTSGSDIAGHVNLVRCEFKNNRNLVAVALSGLSSATLMQCHFHDIFAYRTAGDPGSGYNTGLGECLKVTAATTRVKLIACRFERYARDGVDCYDAGMVEMIGCDWHTSYIGNAVEAKWRTNNLNNPQPITVIGGTIKAMASNGLQLGGKNFKVNGVEIADCGSNGIYLNGGHIDDADTNASLVYSIMGCMLHGNGQSGVYGAEISRVSLVANHAYDNVLYGMYLSDYATACIVTANNLSGNGSRDLRVGGTVGLDTRHRFSANQYSTSLISANATFIDWDGFGVEAVGASGAPTLAKWSAGVVVKNTFDDSSWRRELTAWATVGRSSRIYFSAPVTWNGMDGTSGKVLSVASSPHTVDVTALGVPALATAVLVEIEGQWTAASKSRSCIASYGTGGGRYFIFRSLVANIPNGRSGAVGLSGGQFRIQIATEDMDFSYVKILGYEL